VDIYVQFFLTHHVELRFIRNGLMSMSDVHVSCASRLVQEPCASFLSVCQGYDARYSVLWAFWPAVCRCPLFLYKIAPRICRWSRSHSLTSWQQNKLDCGWLLWLAVTCRFGSCNKRTSIVNGDE